ncbi:hypothetical protein BKA69DRAFT_1045458 [Paraphysoderma sedebokerense]|nr:hypothetical protein BKA69DRAFT_1045458 [Paraphysoderma sedebokerense]
MDTNQYHFSNFVNSSVALPQQHSNLEELNIDSHLLAAAAAASASFLRINSLFPPFYLPPQNEGGASTNPNPESSQSAESVSLPSSLNPENSSNDHKSITVKKKRVRIRPSRSKGKKHVFTEEEMLALKEGVERYGVGQWKKILNDPHLRPRFHPCRTEIALKDKYRNYWGQAPEETTRKQRSPWTDEEDEELLELLTKYGPYAWKQMLRESKVMKGNGRRAGDIRDR